MRCQLRRRARRLRSTGYVLAFLTFGCSSTAGRSEIPPTAPPARLVTLSLVGLNDLHGRLEALPIFGGYLDNLRRARTKDGGAVLVLDAGDMFQGTLASNSNEGAAVIAAYNALGVHAAALGNHELDFGPVGDEDDENGAPADPRGAIKARLSEARFPILSANLTEASSGRLVEWPNLPPSTIVEAAGIRVGLVGVVTMDTPRIVMPRWFTGLGVRSLAPAIVERATELRAAGAAVVVVLAHAGAGCTSFDDVYDTSSCDEGEIFQVARQLPRGLVDVILAGHTHAGIAHVVNGIIIAQAYASGRAFSRVDLFVDARTQRLLETRLFRPHPLCPAPPTELCPPGSYLGVPVTPSPRVSSALAPYLKRAAALARKPLGVNIETRILRAHKRESPLGNLFVDLMLSAVADADAAIANGGSLRSDLPPGDLNYGALYQAMPFDNRLATLALSAGELKTVLVRHLTRDLHGIVSIAGLRVSARCTANELALDLLRADGTPIPDSTRLSIVTTDYLATGGDDLFTPIPPERRVILTPLVRDVLASQLTRRGSELRVDSAIYDATRPRLDLPSARPVVCAAELRPLRGH